MSPFTTFTIAMLLVAASASTIYGLVRAAHYIPEEWSWLASGIFEIIVVSPATLAIYELTGDFYTASIPIVFFAAGTAPALLPRLFKFRSQRVDVAGEWDRAEGVLRNAYKPK